MTEHLTVRTATDADVEPILDLLTHYDLPRSHFEPLYYEDPGFRPEQSLVAEADGALVAHVRLFPRTLRIGEARLPVLGVGNVVTAREWRERGHLRRFLSRVLHRAEREPYAFALLWTYLPQIYARQGFETMTVPTTSVVVPHADGGIEGLGGSEGDGSGGVGGPVSVSVFGESDLPEVEAFADRCAAGLSGTTVRDHTYWRGQLRWLEEDPAGFLVARDSGGGVIGYVRSVRADGQTEVLELGVRPDDAGTARALLAAAGHGTGGALRGFLPRSQRELLADRFAVEVADTPGPMVRLLNPDALAEALSGLLPVRLADQGRSALDISVEEPVRGGAATSGHRPLALRAEPVGVRRLDARPVDEALHCTPASLARLMLGGAPPDAPDWLAALLPARDWVLWDADKF